LNKDIRREVIAERGLIFEQRKAQKAIKKQLTAAFDRINQLDGVSGKVNKKKLGLDDLVAFADVGDGKLNRLELKTKVRIDKADTLGFARTFTDVNFDVPTTKLRAKITSNFFKSPKKFVTDLQFLNKKIAKTTTKGAYARLLLLQTPREIGVVSTSGEKETAFSRVNLPRLIIFDKQTGTFFKGVGDPVKL
jgi:hypothetical protein